MSKIAVVFGGQGSQFAGMGYDIYKELNLGKQIFDKGNKIFPFDLLKIMFENQSNLLNDSKYTQPAITLLSIVIWEHIKCMVGNDVPVCGLSLGEYAAYYASGVLSFEECLQLVYHRGIFMDEECTKTKGAMTAVIGFDIEKIENICKTSKNYCQIANYNSPVQIVISGTIEGVTEVSMQLKQMGAKRIIPLQVAGAFHTTLLKEASLKLNQYLKSTNIKQPNRPLLLNTTGSYYKKELKKEMVKQVTSSVKFTQMIEQLVEDGVDTIIEIGPKKVLSGFIRKIDKTIKTYCICDSITLNQVINEIGGK